MARRQVSIYINGREVENTIKGITGEKRKLNRELRNMVVGSDEYEAKMKDLRGVNGVLRDHRDRLRGVEGGWKKIMKGGVAQFAAVAASAFAVDQVVQYGVHLFKLGAEMEQLGQKAEIVFAQALPQVTAAARENAAAIGLTVSQYTDAATAAGDLLIPMGFTRDEAAALSTGLVDLSGALSEWTGGQIASTEVTNILNKALLGEREELKQLGISISEADVQARLAEKGLKDLTGTMLQQAKATATLELITEKSADAQTAYAENTRSAVRRQAELSAKLQTVTERIATAVIPIFDRLLDSALDIADVLDRLTATTESNVVAFDRQQEKVRSLEKELPGLLNRYEELQGKSELTKDEQEELGNVIQRIGDLTPTAITQVDNYGKALGINAQASRDFLEAEKARLKFINADAISSLENQIEKLETLRNVSKQLVETGETGGLLRGILTVSLGEAEIREAQEDLAAYTIQLQGARAELARLTGENLGGDDTDGGTTNDNAQELGPTSSQIQKQQTRADKLAEQRQQQLQRLQEIVEGFQQEAFLAALAEDERQLERIRLRYEEQIELVKELEAQGITEATALRLELESLQAEALQQARFEQDQAFQEQQLQQIDEQIDAELEAEERLTEAKLEALEERAERERRLRAEEAARQEQERKEQLQAEIRQAEEVAAVASSAGSIVGSVIELLGEKAIENAALGRTLALIQIGINTAEGIAKAVAAGAGLGFPANLGAIASGIAAVTSGIAAARAAFAQAPPLPQRKEGGWLSAMGGDDGTMYRAEYIGTPGTGMLPNHPVLMNTGNGPVLASERGAEYFVSNRSLRDPLILDHVRAIDTLQRRIPQYAEGGATAPLPEAAGGAAAPIPEELIAVISKLSATLDRGVLAVIDDDTAIDLRDRINQLVNASGGVL